jgi:hypothetical protein
MCLKKTSWYTCIYPCRVGALVARDGHVDTATFDRYGWYLGAAFQIQDDILNLIGDYELYGKEIGGRPVGGQAHLDADTSPAQPPAAGTAPAGAAPRAITSRASRG